MRRSRGGSGPFFDGNELYEVCSASDIPRLHVCLGYIAGAADAASSSASYGMVCLPEGISMSQAADIVKRYLRDHPEVRHYAAYDLAANALAEVWPCP